MRFPTVPRSRRGLVAAALSVGVLAAGGVTMTALAAPSTGTPAVGGSVATSPDREPSSTVTGPPSTTRSKPHGGTTTSRPSSPAPSSTVTGSPAPSSTVTSSPAPSSTVTSSPAPSSTVATSPAPSTSVEVTRTTRPGIPSTTRTAIPTTPSATSTTWSRPNA
ncbi:hypothetical protein [Saccharothrix algeriensis]|uniref:Secreted protein n=1 Tax=Saccharothrix algeriensis TaxID=173560 RepID=A0A8T8I5A8_9PSEU|nr:hypothetical protein [Saccharothrix algeriensis]MBM7812096.1 hypothetical protein [Saccharothrix algeriensis]QTR05768.1 hypothetical protein J7S33_15275 [Saccharothrix algeriensis]